MLDHEQRLWDAGYTRVAGLDEAGRGCLAGPVVAAAVILPPGLTVPQIQDSKTLSAEARQEARALIEAEALAVAVGQCSPSEIDELNILWAALEAMRRAAAQCDPAPEYLLVDGNRWFDHPAQGSLPLEDADAGSPTSGEGAQEHETDPPAPWPARTVVKGDAVSQSIAAASIIAKTERDALMHRLHDEHPAYGWASNVGYPTQAHYDALATHGATPHHRRSFTLFRD
jgi:ribonuclease HII